MYQYAVAGDGQPAAKFANTGGTSTSARSAGSISAEEDDFVPSNFPIH
jgi:hypothetical protein